jgi:hypothetical protein
MLIKGMNFLERYSGIKYNAIATDSMKLTGK